MGGPKLLWQLGLCIGSLFILYYNGRTFLSPDLSANVPFRNPLISNVQVPIYNIGTENVVKIENLTSPSSTILMYNRVPKCGSATLELIIKRLGPLNHFDYNYVPGKRKFSKREQNSMIKKMLNREGRSHQAGVGHALFFDDVRDYNGTIVWMNMVRDPVDRFISNYFYHQRNAKEPRDLNKCAAENHPLCTWTVYDWGELQLSFFCGQDPACCKRSNRWALQRAIYHVEKYYSVVAVFEDRHLSYDVLEAYIPMFFTGMKTIEAEKVMINVGSLSKRESITNATKALLRNNLKEDYEFYEFLRQRLYAQAKSIGLL